MDATRRQTLMAAAGFAPFLAVAEALAKADETIEQAQARTTAARAAIGQLKNFKRFGDEEIAMLLYPNFTALDLVGPQYFFACMRGSKVHLVTTNDDLAPVMSDTGLAIQPTMRMADCPADLDILFLPGGGGTPSALKDGATVDFVADRASRASLVTSVCTGALLLGRAGILKGRNATTHWGWLEMLSEFGATPVNERVVRDGNVITGAGVSAGIDFGISVVAGLRGEPYARLVQLLAEYDPQPPFEGGSLEKTPPEIAEPMFDTYAVGRAKMRAYLDGKA
ncbi:MAG: DJ-1/PfpI family protein [Pseudomonadota bacterium]